MCCFSRPVKDVSATRIFARHLDGGRQALAYSMNVAIDEELAMVLPIPIAPGTGEGAVAFVDLSRAPRLFEELARAFPAPSFGFGPAAPQPAAARGATLAVHQVGAFVASFVPTPRDFERLDPRFRLTPDVLSARAEYMDFGFAVFQLAPPKGAGGTVQTVHPMAFTFHSRRPRALFFPTLHVHDGAVPARARFDHTLYCQTNDEVLARTFPFQRSVGALGKHVDASRTRGLVDGERDGFRAVVSHEQPNGDLWYEPPACAGAHVLSGAGELFAFTLSATAAYATELEHRRTRRWHEVARNKLDALHRGLLEGAKSLTTEQRARWSLVPLRPDLEAAWLSNDQVYGSREPSFRPLEPGAERAVRLAITTDGEEAEPQRVELAFARVPTPATVAEIRRALSVVVARAVA